MPLTSTERSRKRRTELKRKAADGDAAAEATLEKQNANGMTACEPALT